MLSLSVQVLEGNYLCDPQFPLCLTSFSHKHKKFNSKNSNQGEEILVITFGREWSSRISSSVRKKSQYRFAYSTEENSETLECSAINDGRSMLAIFVTVLYKPEGLKTETLK